MNSAITSLTHISKGSRSQFILPQLSKSAITKSDFQFYINNDGYLDCTIKTNNDWLFALRFAENCQNYNFELKLNYNSPKLYIEVVKDIIIGEECILWFSTNILALMGIQFLKLDNFKDEKQYICHQCHKLFEFPNPLKIHIALKCDQFKIFELWKTLFENIRHPQVFNNVSTISMIKPINILNNQLVTTDYYQPKNKKEIKFSQHLCTYCGKWYSRKYGLKIHLRTHTGYKPLKCKFCQRSFGDPSNLNKHTRLHLRKVISKIELTSY